MIARMLRPSDVTKPNADEQAKAKELEKTVDEKLQGYDGPVRVDLHTTRRIIECVAANYRANEWIVDVKPLGPKPDEWRSDQLFRLTFTIASPPRSGPGQAPLMARMSP